MDEAAGGLEGWGLEWEGRGWGGTGLGVVEVELHVEKQEKQKQHLFQPMWYPFGFFVCSDNTTTCRAAAGVFGAVLGLVLILFCLKVHNHETAETSLDCPGLNPFRFANFWETCQLPQMFTIQDVDQSKVLQNAAQHRL